MTKICFIKILQQTLNIKKKRVNPKKMQRKINKEKNKPVLSTKAQLSMQESREQSKIIRKKASQTR
ncbi:DUF2992 family protein [Listeria aquatica]|uniref:DUF2992 family protein n=1 Tax=Listeria aquatica TaxID=1494960 RepID=UPI003B97DBC2